MKKVSIYDIAQNLNLSASTVSRAINDSHEISLKTKEMVRAEMQRLKYRPNHLARELKMENHKLLGVFASVAINTDLMPFVTSEKLRGICAVAEPENYKVLVFFEDFGKSAEAKNKLWDIVNNYGLSGILSLQSLRKSVQEKIIAYKVPHVAVNWTYNIARETFAVRTDFYQVTQLALRHFYQKKKRDVTIITWYDLYTENPASTDITLNEYAKAIDDLRDEFPDFKINQIFTEATEMMQNDKQDFFDLVDKVENKNFFCLYYQHSIWLLEYARIRGLKIPEELSVITYDYNDAFFKSLPLRVTGIIQSPYDLGRKGCEMVISAVEGREAESTKLDPILVPGETT